MQTVGAEIAVGPVGLHDGNRIKVVSAVITSQQTGKCMGYPAAGRTNARLDCNNAPPLYMVLRSVGYLPLVPRFAGIVPDQIRSLWEGAKIGLDRLFSNMFRDTCLGICVISCVVLRCLAPADIPAGGAMACACTNPPQPRVSCRCPVYGPDPLSERPPPPCPP